MSTASTMNMNNIKLEEGGSLRAQMRAMPPAGNPPVATGGRTSSGISRAIVPAAPAAPAVSSRAQELADALFVMDDMANALEDTASHREITIADDLTNSVLIKRRMDDIMQKYGGSNTHPFGTWYRDEETNPVTVTFEKEAVHNWKVIEYNMLAIGEALKGSISAFQFKYEKKNTTLKNKLTLALRFIKVSDKKTVLTFLGKYDYDLIRGLLVEPLTEDIRNEQMEEVLECIEQISNETVKKDLILTYVCVAFKMAIANREEAYRIAKSRRIMRGAN